VCGIVGISSDKCISIATLERATRLLKHRGPDNSSVFISEDNTLGFGHTRLAIIDPLERSNQPMEKYGLVLVFNGQIFNKDEIKAELICKGYCFETTSDTEVVIASFHRWGLKSLERFNGFYAFALFDKIERCTFLVRDRLGIKPLVYTAIGRTFIFASEAKAILAFPGITAEPNIDAIHANLIFSFWADREDTYFKGIKALPPGHYATISNGQIALTKYWDIAMCHDCDVDATNIPRIKQRFSDLLYDSVSLRMIADVKVGTFLSGGVDSSLVSAIAAGLTQSEIEALTLSYDQPVGDDLSMARSLVSSIANIRHHVTLISKEDINLKLIDEITYHMEEILFDKAYLALYKLYETANKLGIKVMLSGQGSDEIWLGYLNSSNLFSNASAIDLGYLNRFWRNNFFLKDFTDKKTNRRLISNNLEKNILPYLGKDKLNSLVAMSIKTNLQNMLMQEDRLSMAFGVECRVPFIDFRIVELANSVSSQLKTFDGREKYFVRKIGESVLPAAICKREKSPFPLPPDDYNFIENTLGNAENFIGGRIINEIAKLEPRNLKEISASDRWRLFSLNRLEHIYFQ
jgi:asparagine synthase (glutamine-hydrolysing)